MNWNTLKEDSSIVEKIDVIYNIVAKQISYIDDVSLYSGRSGLCLFLFYYSLYKKKHISLYDKINFIIEHVVESVNLQHSITVYSEIGWLILHLNKNNNLNIDADELFQFLDSDLYPFLEKLMLNNKYDCLNGSISIGLYYYQRYINGCDKCKIYIESLVDLLYKNSIISNGLIKWESEIDFDTHKRGINLGIAHGVPGIILFLIKVHNVKIKLEETKSLIIGAFKYMLSMKRDLKYFKSQFGGTYVSDEAYDNETRLGWCYGDISVGFALYKATLEIEELYPYQNQIIDILLHTTKRMQITQHTDACICHGTAGIAHIYNKLYQYTDIIQFRDLSLFWYEKTIEIAKNDNGFAGYKTTIFDVDSGIEYMYNLSFLLGISGIGLSLISAVSSIEPSWDECLLLS